jgi:VWFA-related protein
MKRKSYATVILLMLIFTASAKIESEQQDEAIKLSADLVLLDAQALSKKNGLALRGLQKEDFTLYEDGVKQYISHFSQDRLTISLVILLDVSSSIAPVFDQLRNAAVQALQKLKPADEVALMVFGGTARAIHEFATDKKIVADSIQNADGTGLERGTIVNEGILQAALYLQRTSNPSNRRVILAITDDVTTQKNPFPSETLVLKKLSESGSVVCGLIFFNPSRRALTAFAPPGNIRSYSEETGGIIINADKKKLEANLTELIEHLRSRYSFGYLPSNQNRDGKFRKIKLELTPEAEQRVEKAKIITRKGYYAPAAGESK